MKLQARISEGIAGVGPELLIAARIYKVDGKTREAAGEPVAVVPLHLYRGSRARSVATLFRFPSAHT